MSTAIRLVWVPVRHGSGRYVFHTSRDCGMHRGKSVPTSMDFAELAGLVRCAYCAVGGSAQERRRIVLALRENGLTFTAIAARLGARWGITRSMAHKDYQRAVRERVA